MLATTIIAVLSLQLPSQDDLGGGTQPGTLSVAVQGNSACATCHASTTVPNLPVDQFRGTMMNLASYDPFFLAAFEIAFDDDTEVAGLCLRCHFPNGYLANRHEPHDGSNLVTSDKEGIACDLCHRMVAPTPTVVGDPYSGLLLSNTQVFIANDAKKRGPIANPVAGGHTTEVSALFADSRLCAQCHEVTNTLTPRLDMQGAQIDDVMPIERTYTEWLNSDYAVGGPDHKTCMDCHMEKVQGQAAVLTSSTTPTREVGRHRLVGGNTLAPKMMKWLATQPGADAFLVAQASGIDAVVAAAQDQLQQKAATLEARTADVDEGTGTLTVRVTNTAGHKLPTGYAEGRRMYLSSSAKAADGTVLAKTGTLSPTTFSFVDGEGPAKLWQVDLAVGGQSSFHFALVNQVKQDNRIPPKGFVPTPDTMPVEGTFEALADGVLAHWDDAALPLGETDCFPVIVDVGLWYQSASGEYFRFLVENAPDYGPTLSAAWDAVGGGAPVLMRSISVAVHRDGTVLPAAGPYTCDTPQVDDAGTADSGNVVTPPRTDAGFVPAPDAGSDVVEPVCACASTADGAPLATTAAFVATIALARRRRPLLATRQFRCSACRETSRSRPSR